MAMPRGGEENCGVNVGDWRRRQRRLISPLVGEMAGRPEGGAKDRGFSGLRFLAPRKWGEVARRSRDGEGSALRRPPLRPLRGHLSPAFGGGEEPKR
ncbi:hypothetical protein EOA23_27475 [Mesorhizobium sp. M2A.F.Ca.ET.042.01.1.1]|nr:hypothetical protein EOA23_27475 [Mesorhizobium sp. M2A.F.Ca.ET.042.01.1.1]